MSKVYFRLSITIPADKLTTVIDVLNREGSELEIKQVANGEAARQRRTYTKRPSGDGVTIDDVVRQAVDAAKGNVFAWSDLARISKANGFGETSIARPLQALLKAGILKKAGHGRYQAVRKI